MKHPFRPRFSLLLLLGIAIVLTFGISSTAPPGVSPHDQLSINLTPNSASVGNVQKHDEFAKWLYDVPPSTMRHRRTAYAELSPNKCASNIITGHAAPVVLLL